MGTFHIFVKKIIPDEVRVLARKTLRDFWENHADSEEPLKAWYEEAEAAEWKSPRQIKEQYATASFLADNRVVFNIKGNKYRLVVKIYYGFGKVFIRFIGTHAEYDKIDAGTI